MRDTNGKTVMTTAGNGLNGLNGDLWDWAKDFGGEIVGIGKDAIKIEATDKLATELAKANRKRELEAQLAAQKAEEKKALQAAQAQARIDAAKAGDRSALITPDVPWYRQPGVIVTGALAVGIGLMLFKSRG